MRGSASGKPLTISGVAGGAGGSGQEVQLERAVGSKGKNAIWGG